MMVSGVLAFLSLVFLRRSMNATKNMIIATMVMLSISLGFMFYVGYEGGKIKHAEFHTGQVTATDGQEANEK